MRNMLRFKAALIGSPFEELAKKARRWASLARPNLEMAEVPLEEERLPIILGRLLNNTSNVLDVSCHIGSFLSLATKIAPQGQHAAVEASPQKANMLRSKFPKVPIEQVAISDSNGTALFQEDLDNPGFSRLGETASAAGRVKKYEVRTATIDSLSLEHFDLVKLDIEGAELAALRGGATFSSDAGHI
jgi:FkbM family methyltransferase